MSRSDATSPACRGPQTGGVKSSNTIDYDKSASGMNSLFSVRRVFLAVFLSASASTVQASGFTLNINPRTHPDISTEVVEIDPKVGSGLLTVCGAMAPLLPNPDPHIVSLTGSPGGSPGCGAFSANRLAFEKGIGLGIVDRTTLLQGPLADFNLVPADSASSQAIFRFLANLTASEHGLGVGTFTDAEINATRGRAADFLAWFRSETEKTDAETPALPLEGFSLFRIVLAGLAAVAVVAEIIFLGVSFLLRRAAKQLGQER
jgi:hypothetical protein